MSRAAQSAAEVPVPPPTTTTTTHTIDSFNSSEHAPTIIHNASNHTMIVFQERATSGTYYNIQVLHPGEAMGAASRQQSLADKLFTAGRQRRQQLLPPSLGFLVSSYKVHAIVGDESCLASLVDESTINLLKNAAIPATAFVIGCLVTAIAAGTLAGPSVALAPLVSGVVINGVVVDSAAVAAGTVLATRTKAITDFLLKDRPDGQLAAKTKGMQPPKKGKGRYLVVTGGLSDGAVSINEIGSKEKFEKRYSVSVWKEPLKNCGNVGGGSNRNKIWRIGNNKNGQETQSN